MNAKAVHAADLQITEGSSGYAVRAEMPGVPKEAIRLDVDRGVLSLTTSDRFERDGREEYLVECHCGAWAKSFQMPPDADPTRIRFVPRDGGADLTLPKFAPANRPVKRVPEGPISSMARAGVWSPRIGRALAGFRSL